MSKKLIPHMLEAFMAGIVDSGKERAQGRPSETDLTTLSFRGQLGYYGKGKSACCWETYPMQRAPAFSLDALMWHLAHNAAVNPNCPKQS